MGLKIELYNDHFENAKRYGIPHAQLIIADIPYNLGNNAYASNPMWYVGGDNKNGESDKANKTFFDTDKDFKINNFFDFCTRYLKKEPKEKGQAPAMVVFCAFEQIQSVIDEGKKHGLLKSYPLVFIKNYSAQVLKANMKVVDLNPFGECFSGTLQGGDLILNIIVTGMMIIQTIATIFSGLDYMKGAKKLMKD